MALIYYLDGKEVPIWEVIKSASYKTSPPKKVVKKAVVKKSIKKASPKVTPIAAPPKVQRYWAVLLSKTWIDIRVGDSPVIETSQAVYKSGRKSLDIVQKNFRGGEVLTTTSYAKFNKTRTALYYKDSSLIPMPSESNPCVEIPESLAKIILSPEWQKTHPLD